MTARSPEILLIDDQRDKLLSLAGLIRDNVNGTEVREWCPSEDEDPSLAFKQMVSDRTLLVVTEYDLTAAVRGLFGHSVVAWCRDRFIPVGDFSRGHLGVLSKEPDLFELRVPREEAKAVAYVARMFEGFKRIQEGLEQGPSLLIDGRSPAHVLAMLLGRNNLESRFSPYLSSPGSFNSSLLDALTGGEHGIGVATKANKTRLLVYILGHVLVNAILKYPGPILAEGPLCAYLAVSSEDFNKVAGLFDGARYTGPFYGGERLFWRDDVDEVVEELAGKFNIEDSQNASFGDYHRAVIGKALGGSIAKHGCDRCDGVKGGFWCPFTKRSVCERSDCSSTASSWVPTGADACRVERVFFEAWSPILGL